MAAKTSDILAQMGQDPSAAPQEEQLKTTLIIISTSNRAAGKTARPMISVRIQG